jgi:hypothetical protein
LKVQRSDVEKHIRNEHAEDVATEVRGMRDALLRMVNLMRPGVRCFSSERLRSLMHPLKKALKSKRVYKMVWDTVVDVLGNALVAVQDETHTGRHFGLLGPRYKAWLK